MEGTTPNQSPQSLDELIKTMESRIAEITSGMMEIKEKQEEDFTCEGIDITDSLPTMDEALFLKKENDELKENDKKRIEEIEKAYDNVMLVQGDRDFWEQTSNNLKEENEKLKKDIETLKEKKVAIHTQDKLPFPEPPLGAPYHWKNALCHHQNCNLPPNECGYAHTMEEARYYQKRLLRKDIKAQNEIKELKSKIPANHHKRLSPYDKKLITSIKHDIQALQDSGEADEVAEYELYAPKIKLLLRLLK